MLAYPPLHQSFLLFVFPLLLPRCSSAFGGLTFKFLPPTLFLKVEKLYPVFFQTQLLLLLPPYCPNKQKRANKNLRASLNRPQLSSRIPELFFHFFAL
jgi:hypothetical protein